MKNDIVGKTYTFQEAYNEEWKQRNYSGDMKKTSRKVIFDLF